jgi:hypothetical protein
VVAVVGLPGSEEAGWAPALTVALAGAWSRAGNRVVLADFGLSRPLLHTELGLSARDGVSDAVLFGASVGRVTEAVTVEGDPVFFIGAGTAVADPAAVAEQPRWAAICDGFQEAGATLVTFLPWGAETLPGALDHATDVVLLGTSADDPSAVEGVEEGRVLAFVGRDEPAGEDAGEGPAEAVVAVGGAGGADASTARVGLEETAGADPAAGDVTAGGEADEAAGAAPGTETEAPAAPDSPAAEDRREREAEPATAGARAAPEAAARMGEGPTPRPGPEGGSGGGRLLLVFLFLVLAAVVAWLLGLLPVPGSTPGDTTSREAVPETVAPLAAAGPGADETGGEEAAAGSGAAGAGGSVDTSFAGAEPPAGSPAPPRDAAERSPSAAWAVAVEAHADREAAWSSRRLLEETVPEQLWITVPVEVEGTVYHRVLFGTASTWSAAQALREEVADRTGRSPASWISRPTRLAYRLDEQDSLPGARARASRLRARGIPAYVLAVTYADGTERFRVYAGGFADADEAGVLGERLADAGVTGAELAERTGRRPG